MDILICAAPQCSYCESAKAMLAERNLAYREVDVSRSPANLAELQARLPREKALPQIFVDGVHIGGADDLRHAFETGAL